MKRLMTTLLILMSAASPAVAAETALTVYNTDLAIVRIVDSMSFEKGVQAMAFTGVANRIDPTTVRFTAKNAGVTVVEQNYRYDLVDSRKVLERYIDRSVTLVVEGESVIEGVLLSVDGDIVLRDSSGRVNIVRLDAIERYDLPELPGGLVTRPTLVWTLHSERAATSETEISYMTGGFFWHAEYSAVISDDETKMEISSWVSVDNRSGASFENADLKLVAGDVHRTAPQMAPEGRGMMKSMVMEDASIQGFEERGLFEYHLYDLGRKTDIMNNEIKQISLFDPATSGAEKRFVYDSSRDAGKVSVGIEFANTEKNGLGMALPAGVVRVYKRDSDGAVEFVGEDRIGHTPKNEKVRLTLGKAFDIAAERNVTDVRRITDRVREQSVEIVFRNRKDENVTVTAVEKLWGDWEILDASHKYVKKDAYTVEFTVPVSADGESKVTYTFRMK